jgi:cell wall-associated NlpC family hydrolase
MDSAGIKSLLMTIIVTVAIALAGCSHKPEVKQLPYFPPKKDQPKAAARPAAPELKRMGYTVQVGAFSNVDNAIRLTKSLEKEGLDAFYYRNSAGLFRVRFGDYKTRAEAEKAAGEIISKGIAESYRIISPGEYIQTKNNIPDKSISVTGDSLREHIVVTASGFVGLPYQWGDISPTKGFDCSSLVMAVFQLNGLVVPRTSKDQFINGVPVDPENLDKGDLLFFTTNGTGQISHVGIYVGDGMFIHAPGKGKPIREESLNTQYYRDRYMGACTYLQ